MVAENKTYDMVPKKKNKTTSLGQKKPQLLFSCFIFVRIWLLPQKRALSSQNLNSICDTGFLDKFAALMVTTGATRTLVHISGQWHSEKSRCLWKHDKGHAPHNLQVSIAFVNINGQSDDGHPPQSELRSIPSDLRYFCYGILRPCIWTGALCLSWWGDLRPGLSMTW